MKKKPDISSNTDGRNHRHHNKEDIARVFPNLATINIGHQLPPLTEYTEHRSLGIGRSSYSHDEMITKHPQAQANLERGRNIQNAEKSGLTNAEFIAQIRAIRESQTKTNPSTTDEDTSPLIGDTDSQEDIA